MLYIYIYIYIIYNSLGGQLRPVLGVQVRAQRYGIRRGQRTDRQRVKGGGSPPSGARGARGFFGPHISMMVWRQQAALSVDWSRGLLTTCAAEKLALVIHSVLQSPSHGHCHGPGKQRSTAAACAALGIPIAHADEATRTYDPEALLRCSYRQRWGATASPTDRRSRTGR